MFQSFLVDVDPSPDQGQSTKGPNDSDGNGTELVEKPHDYLNETAACQKNVLDGGLNSEIGIKDPVSATDHNEADVQVEELRGLLNELLPENFESICDQFKKLTLDGSQDGISAVANIVIDEVSFSESHAKMVKEVCQASMETSKKFRKVILDQCQREFERTIFDEKEISKKQKEIEDAKGNKKEVLKMELKGFRIRKRRRSLGTVHFIGELFNLQMLSPKTIVDCVQMLLDEESYELLCNLLTTVGQKLEISLLEIEKRVADAKSRGGPIPKYIPENNYMDKTFDRLRALSNKSRISSRVRSGLVELVGLRDQKWVPNHLGGQSRTSAMKQNQSTQQKMVDWNTVRTISTKSSRFSQVKKSNDVSNSRSAGVKLMHGKEIAPTGGSLPAELIQSSSQHKRFPSSIPPPTYLNPLQSTLRPDKNGPKGIDDVRRDSIREEQEKKRQIPALFDINPDHKNDQCRTSSMKQNQSTQSKMGDWNTVPSPGASRFSQVKKCLEVSNKPGLPPKGLGWVSPQFVNHYSSNNIYLPPRIRALKAQQEQLRQKQ
ncbi:unnamed protein product [Allacma fusca]|uniref:MIF4G domain-containing protein n=1 Tax=Allacma fusca TaxID=39272 RepID=A0A8J2KNB7_9HEXA|nr:unnamed protein product [Allacma fusca]